MDIHELLKKVWPEWEITERIGEGSFGVVYKAKRTDLAGESWSAVKVTSIPRSESELDSLSSEGLSPEQTRTYLKNIVRDYSDEIRLMESVKGHSNIVSIEDYRIYENKDKTAWDIFIRMELLTPLTKYAALNDVNEKDIFNLGTDLCRALSACAVNRIVHRDIKPENIFINSLGSFKLGDFGVARRLDHATMDFTRAGAMNYMAPETVNGTEFETDFDDAVKADIYSLGLVMYWMANRFRLPFLPKDKKILSLEDRRNAFGERVRGTELPRPSGEISDGLWRVIRTACAFDPGRRYASADEMLEALEAAGRGSTGPVGAGTGAGRKNGEKNENKKEGGPRKENEIKTGWAPEEKDDGISDGRGWKKPHAKRLIAFAAAAILLAAGMTAWLLRPRGAVLAIRYLDADSGDAVAQPTALVLAEGSHSVGPGEPVLPAGYAAEDADPRRVTVKGNRADPEEIVFLYRPATAAPAPTPTNEPAPAPTKEPFNSTKGWKSNGAVAVIELDTVEHISIGGGGFVQYCSFIPPESATYYISVESEDGHPINAMLFDAGIGSAFLGGINSVEGNKVVIQFFLDAGKERFFYFRFKDDTQTGMVRVLIEKRPHQTSGTCGDDLTWTLADDGTLTISGHGDMDEVPYDDIPWYDMKTDVKKLVVEEGVTSIGDKAFFRCAYLMDAALPSTLKKIGEDAFFGCTSLTELVIPEGVERLGGGVIYDCSGLESISLPASLEKIDDDHFAGGRCYSLKEIRVAPDSKHFRVVDGVLFDYEMETLLYHPQTIYDTVYYIPDTVRTIGIYAFDQCYTLGFVYIPDSVETIKACAFSECTNLRSVLMPDSVREVQHYAFYGCSSLKEVRLSGRLTSLTQQCFGCCDSLESIIFPKGFRSVGAFVFSESPNLKSVYIPASVTNIHYGAFDGCDQLTIYGQPYSVAQSFAQENGIPFIEAPHPTMIPYEALPSPTPSPAAAGPS
ncbi:MAG: leucine-rich repeat protein [Clostridia bacterium]|nr:leucine-rich repeat protein [Clostridia bacterium]